MRLFKKSGQKRQIGIHHTPSGVQLVWFDDQRQPQSLQLPTALLTGHHSGLPAPLDRIMAQPHCLVAAVPPHFVWTKTLQLPQKLNDQECFRQCRFVIQKELPLPLDALCFDYHATPLPHRFRLDIYAVRKQAVEQLQQIYLPFRLDVLDIAAHAIMRAFHYLLKTENTDKPALYLYQDEAFCLALCERPSQRQMLHSATDLVALHRRFAERFANPPLQVYVYAPPEAEISPEWQRVETPLPFLALGNALWREMEQEIERKMDQKMPPQNLSSKPTALSPHCETNSEMNSDPTDQESTQ